MDFYAVSPAPSPENSYLFWKINKEKQKITYSSFDEYKTAGGDQNLDVMYAVAKGQDKNSGKVSLAFKHILSQVLFKAKTEDDKMEVEIKEMKFNNCQVAGTFTIPVGDPKRTDWTQPGSIKAPFTVGMDGNKTVTSTSNEVITKPMLFVPQTLIAWVPSSETKAQADNANPAHSYLEISCRIKQNDTYLHGKNGFETLYVPFSATWEPGKCYVYTLIFGGGYNENGQPILSRINFSASVKDWEPDAGNSTNSNDIETQQ